MIKSIFSQSTIIYLYNNLLKLTKGRGEHSLAKLDSFIFRQPRKITISNNNDVTIIIPPDPHFFRYLIKTHESHISTAIKMLCSSGDLIVDIGANIGYFSAYAASVVGTQGNVFCFEPEKNNFELLNLNCNLINKMGFNLTPYKLAVSSENKQLILNVHRYSTYHSIENDALDKIEDKQVIESITLDDWAKNQNIKTINFLKCDTEGHEDKVLMGAQSLYKNKAIDISILECRSEKLCSFIDSFAEEFKLHSLVYDGKQWYNCKLSNLSYKTDCLLSIQPIDPLLLC